MLVTSVISFAAKLRMSESPLKVGLQTLELDTDDYKRLATLAAQYGFSIKAFSYRLLNLMPPPGCVSENVYRHRFVKAVAAALKLVARASYAKTKSISHRVSQRAVEQPYERVHSLPFYGPGQPPAGSWRECSLATVCKFKAVVTCPHRHGLTLKHHAVTATGVVLPSVA